jgi:RNA methyltransferase, TrmH family
MGTLFSVPIVTMGRDESLQWLRAEHFRVIAADPLAKMSYREADYGGRVALVVGNERLGLAPFWHQAADLKVSIPMMGRADSLNVGNAAALLLYEAMHSQLGAHGG